MSSSTDGDKNKSSTRLPERQLNKSSTYKKERRPVSSSDSSRSSSERHSSDVRTQRSEHRSLSVRGKRGSPIKGQRVSMQKARGHSASRVELKDRPVKKSLSRQGRDSKEHGMRKQSLSPGVRSRTGEYLVLFNDCL